MALITIHQDQRLGDIVGTQVARKIILQGGPSIQTVVSLRGYVSALEELWDERRVSLNHRCMPTQLDTIITPKVAPRGGHIVVQAHLLPENTGDIEWMNLREK